MYTTKPKKPESTLSPYYQALHNGPIRVPREVTEPLYNTTDDLDREQRRLATTIATGTQRAMLLRDPWDGCYSGRPGSAYHPTPLELSDDAGQTNELLPTDNFTSTTNSLRGLASREGPRDGSAGGRTTSTMLKRLTSLSMISHAQHQRRQTSQTNVSATGIRTAASAASVNPIVLQTIELASSMTEPLPTCSSSRIATRGSPQLGPSTPHSPLPVSGSPQSSSPLVTSTPGLLSGPKTLAVGGTNPHATGSQSATFEPVLHYTNSRGHSIVPNPVPYPSPGWAPYVPLARTGWETGSSPSTPDSPGVTALPPVVARAAIAESIARQATAAIAEDTLRIAVLPIPPPALTSTANDVSYSELHSSREAKRRSEALGEFDRSEIHAVSLIQPNSGLHSKHLARDGGEFNQSSSFLSAMTHDHIRKAARSNNQLSNPPVSATQRHRGSDIWKNSATAQRFRAIDFSTWQGDTKKSADSIFTSPFFQ